MREATPEELAYAESQQSPRYAVTAIIDGSPARKAKLLRQAPHIRDQVHLDDILESFPAEDRAALREQVKPLLKFAL